MSNPLREQFLLDDDVVFLNHGSFGATPRAVLEAQHAWQRRVERQPVQFYSSDIYAALAEARRTLGAFMGADADALAFVPNATVAVNMVARSLALAPGDEIVMSDHEYGACERVWTYVCRKSGARIVRSSLPLPSLRADAMAELFWQAVSPSTKLIFLSHITSPTALRLPVEQICMRARAAGIMTMVDGAHVPGQLEVNLAQIDADFYTGNAHKWLLTPKGAGFLYADETVRERVEPLVISWGWGDEPTIDAGSPFLSMLEWPGTHDPTPYLAVPAAIAFMRQHDWPAVRARCHALALRWLDGMAELTGMPTIYGDETTMPPQMVVAELPLQPDLAAFKARLYREYRVEMPAIAWNERHFLRLSAQGYNDAADIDAALNAIAALLSR